jgi:hypothetical protein
MSNVIGKVILIGNTEEVGQNGFTKRMLVVETDEQYSQKIAIDFVKDKTSILDKYKIGDAVNVSINLRGSEYNGRYFVNLQGWRIEAVGTAPSTPQAPAKQFDEKFEDDVPF